MADVTPLFPGQTGLTPGRRAELERATALVPDQDGLARTDEAPPPSGLLAQLLHGEQAAACDALDMPPEEGSAMGDRAPMAEGEAHRQAVPEAVAALQAALASFNVNDLASPDAEVRAEAERRLRSISDQAYLVDSVFGGGEQMIRTAFPAPLADRVVASFARLPPARTVSVPGDATEMLHADADDQQAAQQEAQQTRPGGGGGGGGGVFDALARFPFTFLAAGGSLAMEALRRSVALANSGVAAGQRVAHSMRQNSFDIIGRQVNSLHADIEREAQWLRSHGLEGVVDEMKASGHTLRDAVAGMERGGPLEKVGLQFKGLMVDPQFREHYEGLQQKLNRFDSKLTQYVQGGAVLGRDVDGDAAKLLDSLHTATEGFPTQKKDGSFALLSDRLREIAERIREVINDLFKRLAPGKG